MEVLELKKFFAGKKVFITGHTGFKGAWLVLLLKEFGAQVCAYSLEPESNNGNLFLDANIAQHIDHNIGNVCDLTNLQHLMSVFQPEIVIHLAAQAIVLTSYQDPVSSFLTNTQGTVHILECVRKLKSCKAVLCITSDKCYDNKEWAWAYRENDTLGGKDPYSASKAMAELAINSYRESFLSKLGIACASARAGNVIGGGDFSRFRIIPDIAKSLAKGEQIILRNPLATRPWQHVLDAIYGYLILTYKMYNDPINFSKAYNFAPFKNADTFTVQAVTELYLKSLALPLDNYKIDDKAENNHEATLLQLDASLTLNDLNWYAKLSVQESIQLTAQWFNMVEKKESTAYEMCMTQIKDYCTKWG